MWYLDMHTEENIIKNMNRFGYLPKIAEYIGELLSDDVLPRKTKRLRKSEKREKQENRKRNISRRLQQGKTAYRDAAKRR